MMVLCPSCWRTVAADAARCPHCGADSRQFHERAFREKLLGALSHPDRDTAVRAVLILAARRDPAALRAVEDTIRRFAKEPLVVAALMNALCVIPTADARRMARAALEHPSVIVRRAAARVLEEIEERERSREQSSG